MKRHRHRPPMSRWSASSASETLDVGGDLAAVLRTLETSETTCTRWRSQHGGMRASEASRLRELEPRRPVR